MLGVCIDKGAICCIRCQRDDTGLSMHNDLAEPPMRYAPAQAHRRIFRWCCGTCNAQYAIVTQDRPGQEVAELISHVGNMGNKDFERYLEY